MKTMDWLDLPAVATEVVDEVHRTGESVVITKKGVPVMRIEPVDAATLAEFNARRLAR